MLIFYMVRLVSKQELLTSGNTFKAVNQPSKKPGAVFVDLTAAYDTVWRRGLTCKLLRLLPDKHMVHMIMEMVSNRSFTLPTRWSKEQVTTPQEWRPTGICPGAPTVQHLHLRPANHHLQKVWIPPDLEAKAQHHENVVGSLPSQQQGS